MIVIVFFTRRFTYNTVAGNLPIYNKYNPYSLYILRSSPVLRGYTCGLWMVFHAVTVNAYRKAQDKGTLMLGLPYPNFLYVDNGDSFHPVALLHAIRDWVGAFFACEHCRAHFLRMTTKTAKIESLVSKNLLYVP